MKKIFWLCLLGSMAVHANPILTADSQCYDLTAENCPSGYRYSEDNGGHWFILNNRTEGDSIVVWHDLSSVPVGEREWLIKAVNETQESETVSFNVVIEEPSSDGSGSPPLPPTGFRIISGS